MAVSDVVEQRAEDGSDVMCYTCGTSELVRHSLRCQAACHVEAQGQSFEHILKFLLFLLLLLIVVKTVINNVHIGDLYTNAFLMTALHFLFSPSKKKRLVITKNAQKLRFMQMFPICESRTYLLT